MEYASIRVSNEHCFKVYFSTIKSLLISNKSSNYVIHNENNSCKFIERCNAQWVNKDWYIRYYRRFANCGDGCDQAGSDVCPQCGCNEGYKPIFCFSNLVLRMSLYHLFWLFDINQIILHQVASINLAKTMELALTHKKVTTAFVVHPLFQQLDIIVKLVKSYIFNLN